MTYHIAVCDDEPVFLQDIASQIQGIMALHHYAYSLKCFPDSPSLLACLSRNPSAFDLILLDIMLNKDSGLELAAVLREMGNSVPIVFITSSPDYLLEGYAVEAVGYLLKPVSLSKLEETLLRSFRKMERRSIVIHTPVSTAMFRPEEILYAEVTGKTLYVHTLADTSLLSGISLNIFEETLPSDSFFRCHRSYIVSLPAIRSIRRYEITLKNGETIPVSRSRYIPLQETLLKWTTDRNLGF